MKIHRYLLALGAVAAMGLAACSNDDGPNGPQLPTPKFTNFATLKSGDSGNYTFSLTETNSFDSVTVTAAQPAFARDAKIGNRYLLYYTNSSEDSAKPNPLQPGPITMQGYQTLYTANALYGTASQYSNWSFGQRDGVMVTEMNVTGNWVNFTMNSLYNSAPSLSLVVDKESITGDSKVARIYLFNDAQHPATIDLKPSPASFNIAEVWKNREISRIEVYFCHMSKIYTIYADRPASQQTITPGGGLQPAV